MFRNSWRRCFKPVQPMQRLHSMELKDLNAISVQYAKIGEPMKVLELTESRLEPPMGTKVLVKVLAAPVTAADVKSIKGKYPIKSELPQTAGHECVGVVLSVGDRVKRLKPGDRVVPAVAGLGTWTTLAVWDENQLFSISKKLGLAEAATLAGDSCIAYRILHDFVKLQPGDTVIQNGAHTDVGRAVHQLCKVMKLNSVGILGDIPNLAAVYAQLKGLGATEVVTEREFKKGNIFQTRKLKKPKLALNFYGSRTTFKLARQLRPGGVLVTYAGIPKPSIMNAVGSIIFNDIAFRGFWMTRRHKQQQDQRKCDQMLCALTEHMEKGQLVAPPNDMVPMKMFRERAVGAFCPQKMRSSNKLVILNMTC